MTTRLGTIYTTDTYVEIEVLDEKGLATYFLIDENNSSHLNFDIDKANTDRSYTSNWVENNEEVFIEEWKIQQADGRYTW